jgi:dethiobiotin synthetase
VAPALAAELAHEPIELAALLAARDRVVPHGDFLVVETAGGLLSPYSADLTGADLAAAFGLPVLLVARNGLGTINHTALALAELRRRALPLAGVVLVDTSPATAPDRPHNARLIEQLTGERPLGVLPFVDGLDPDRLADAFLASVDAEPLFAKSLRPRAASGR